MDSELHGDVAVGDPAPDFRLPDGEGHEIALSDYRDRSNVVLYFVRAFE
jgi:peroxiredoxin